MMKNLYNKGWLPKMNKKNKIYEGARYKFVIKKEIGSGGNGKVYDVDIIGHPKLDFVAKFFSADKRNLKKCNKRFERFKKEIEYVNKLTDIEGIMLIEDCNLSSMDNSWYLMKKAREYKVNTRKKLNEKLDDIMKIALVIKQLHSRDMEHRDIEPDNILILNNRVYLTDFGLLFCDNDIDNLTDLNVTDVFYKGKRLNEDAPIRVRPCSHVLKHTVHLDKVKAERFLLPISKKKTHVIEIHAGQITTTDLTISLPPTLNFEPFGGYSKIAAVERHHNTGKIGVAVAKGYGIRNGAVASSVSHDSHNIIVIGDNDADMAIAVNEIIRTQGGYTVVENGKVYETLALPIMGLMSDAGFENVNEALQRMIQKAHQMGVASQIDPFVTLSFLALPVIPELRITPRGICKMTAKGPAILS